MFIKFNTLEEAEAARKVEQKVIDGESRKQPMIIAPPIPTWDGKFAIPKETEFEHGGELVESIDPPVIEEE